MGKPSAPKAPDPVALANAQAAANTQTAQEQQRLNMINSTSPYGSVTYQADPSAPGGYSQNTSLSPGQQQLYDQGLNVSNQAYNVAGQQIGRVGNALNTPLSTDGLPGLNGTGGNTGGIRTGFSGGGPLQYGYDSGGQIQQSVDQGGALARSFNPGQAVQGSIGPTDFTKDREAVTDAVWQAARNRLDPMWNQNQTRLDTQLAAQGFGMNSTGTQSAQDTLGRSRNDAYGQALLGSIQAGSDQQQRFFDQSLQQGQFANTAAAQQYAQNYGLAAFGNEAELADYNRRLTAGQFANNAQNQGNQQNYQAAQFNNAAAGQDFGQNAAMAQFQNQAQNQQYQQQFNNAQLANTARNQGLQERAYLQNQPINQLSALLSSGQVQMPTGINYSPTQVAGTDVLGANAMALQQQNANYQSKMGLYGGGLSGLFGLGSAFIGR
jgi:hypothetical protein